MVTFSTPEQADICVTAVNGRWFAGRRLEASNWDGRSKFAVAETDEERARRLEKWHADLEQDSRPVPSPSTTADTAAIQPSDDPTTTSTPAEPSDSCLGAAIQPSEDPTNASTLDEPPNSSVGAESAAIQPSQDPTSASTPAEPSDNTSATLQPSDDPTAITCTGVEPTIKEGSNTKPMATECDHDDEK